MIGGGETVIDDIVPSEWQLCVLEQQVLTEKIVADPIEVTLDRVAKGAPRSASVRTGGWYSSKVDFPAIG